MWRRRWRRRWRWIPASKPTRSVPAKADKTKASQLVLYKSYFAKQYGYEEDNIDIKYFIVKRKLIEGYMYPQKRVQDFVPASGKPTRNKLLKDIESFINAGFVVASTSIVGDAVKMIINVTSTTLTMGVLKIMYDAAGANKFTLFNVSNGSAYSQSDPRSNVVNNQVVWQPCLSIFDEGVESMSTFVGDMQIILTPNSNWKTAAVESALGNYENDIQHGVDYSLGIKSMRFYG